MENCLLWHIKIAAAFIPMSTVKCIEDFEEPLAIQVLQFTTEFKKMP